MKKLSCQDLGGPCAAELIADSFEEMANKSRQHVVEQIQAGDDSHKLAADRMIKAAPEQQQAIIAEFKRKFEAAPDI